MGELCLSAGVLDGIFEGVGFSGRPEGHLVVWLEGDDGSILLMDTAGNTGSTDVSTPLVTTRGQRRSYNTTICKASKMQWIIDSVFSQMATTLSLGYKGHGELA